MTAMALREVEKTHIFKRLFPKFVFSHCSAGHGTFALGELLSSSRVTATTTTLALHGVEKTHRKVHFQETFL